jgi:hypothetical protein
MVSRGHQKPFRAFLSVRLPLIANAPIGMRRFAIDECDAFLKVVHATLVSRSKAFHVVSLKALTL